MGGKTSQEFTVPIRRGDTFIACNNCDYAARAVPFVREGESRPN
jgi:hypothetical protein